MSSQPTRVDEFLASWTAAEQAGDAIALDNLLVEEFVGVGPLGFVLSKAEWLERHAARDLTYEEFDLDEVQKRSYSDTVVVVARQKCQGTYRGHPLPSDTRVMLVIVKQANAWQLASIQISFVAGTPGAPPMPGG